MLCKRRRLPTLPALPYLTRCAIGWSEEQKINKKSVHLSNQVNALVWKKAATYSPALPYLTRCTIGVWAVHIYSRPLKTKKARRRNKSLACSVWKKAATYSPALHCSTIGASGLNFSVRNGKRWNTTAITAWYTFIISITYLQAKCMIK